MKKKYFLHLFIIISAVTIARQLLTTDVGEYWYICWSLYAIVFGIIAIKLVDRRLLLANWYVIAFIGILLTPELVSLLELDTKIISENEEKRALAQKPIFRLSKDYIKEYEAYYNDNFGLRASLIHFGKTIKLSLLGVSSVSSNVVKEGKDGFLFLASTYDIEPSYTNTNLYSQEELEKVYQIALERKTSLEQQGILFLQGYWPNKHTIYNEELPQLMKDKVKNTTSLADQITSFFKEKGMFFLNVKDEFLATKKTIQLYRKLDTHWNSDGAYEGYKAFCEKTYPYLRLVPFKKSEFKISYNKTQKGDLIALLGLGRENNFYQEELPLYQIKDRDLMYKFIDASDYPPRTMITINENINNKKVVVVFNDSYGKLFVPFLSLHYYKVIYIDASNRVYFDNAIIEQAKPSVVISYAIERYLNAAMQ